MKLTRCRIAVALATGILCQSVFAADPVATVNGQHIPAERLEIIVNEQRGQGQPDSPQLREAVREELIRREVLSQAAQAAGTQDKPAVQTQLELARQAIVIRAYLQDYMAANPVSDADIEKEYESIKGRLGGTEYKPRHILVETEDEAQQIIDRLRAGEDFAELAKQSKDPGSRDKGGELGWSTADLYVPPFAEALASLEKGQMTMEPVQSDFGYHIIELLDEREVEPPPIAEVRQELKQHLEQQRVENHMNALREKATIE
ncbi:peptidylprolyl isomerase [Pseudazoarcus pumilus]|uniref:peptidylprolyl isomerase n=1 Tax=Pseudazoarcus pumilus TaxID=2067960 RepID=A0A2I6S6I5_9RHOO|nr:peptidylprolyl isomerase [Pseudazoarcus pumilus]AUN94873.1 peptidylprolyl isomerase [Pseudazoarcus pumilus]